LYGFSEQRRQKTAAAARQQHTAAEQHGGAAWQTLKHYSMVDVNTSRLPERSPTALWPNGLIVIIIIIIIIIIITAEHYGVCFSRKQSIVSSRHHQ
jgi:hypothetical protein